MTENLRIAPQPWMTAAATRAVMAALAPAGPARFVGGCVRDTLARRPRVGDVDIATPAAPERVMELLAARNIRAIPTGIAHGTVTAVVDKAHFEITTLRRDVKTFGRHAEVAFTDDWREDAARRDFTINAMSLTEPGELFDYFGGRADLAAGRVRFVGEAGKRIAEDVLRLLRFFRFHAHYGKGVPDAEALAAAAAAAYLLPGLSGERVWAEFARILEAADPAAALALMEGAGVLAQVLPARLREGRGLARLRALAAIERTEGLAAAPDALRRLAALHEPDPAAAAATAERLKLSRALRERLVRLARDGTALPADLGARGMRRALYRDGAGLCRDRLMLSWAAARAEMGGARGTRAVDADYSALLEITHSFKPPAFPLGGADAGKLGLAPGPEMGAALRAVEEWWVEGDFGAGREDLLARLAAAVKAAR